MGPGPADPGPAQFEQPPPSLGWTPCRCSDVRQGARLREDRSAIGICRCRRDGLCGGGGLCQASRDRDVQCECGSRNKRKAKGCLGRQCVSCPLCGLSVVIKDMKVFYCNAPVQNIRPIRPNCDRPIAMYHPAAAISSYQCDVASRACLGLGAARTAFGNSADACGLHDMISSPRVGWTCRRFLARRGRIR